MTADTPACVHVDLIDDCHAPVAAGLTTRRPNVFEWYCAEHAVIVLCERHRDAVRGALLIAEAKTR